MNRDFNILIVDDSKADRVLLTESLKSIESDDKNFTFNISQANNIENGLNKLNESIYDFVFLDFILSDSDGFQLLSNLSESQKEQTKIIFITSFGNDLIQEDSLSVGARAYMDKNDINSRTLKTTLSRFIH